MSYAQYRLSQTGRQSIDTNSFSRNSILKENPRVSLERKTEAQQKLLGGAFAQQQEEKYVKMQLSVLAGEQESHASDLQNTVWQRITPKSNLATRTEPSKSITNSEKRQSLDKAGLLKSSSHVANAGNNR